MPHALVDGTPVQELYVYFPNADYGWMRTSSCYTEFKRLDFMTEPPAGFHASPGPQFNCRDGWDSKLGDQKIMAADLSTATGLKVTMSGAKGISYLFIPINQIQATWR